MNFALKNEATRANFNRKQKNIKMGAIVENVEQILTDHEEDLTSCRERLTVLKSLLTEKLETIKKLDEAILESIKPKEFEKEIEDSGEFCANVYSILAKIDFSLENNKHGGHTQTPAIQGNSTSKNTEGAKVKLPKLELKTFSGNYQNGRVSGTHFSLLSMETLAFHLSRNSLI